MVITWALAVYHLLLKSLPKKAVNCSMTRRTLPELEAYVRSIDTAEYAQRRNYLGGSSELSEYITRGVISLPQVRELVLENNAPAASYKFINELAWREYWQLVWRVRGDDIFDYIRPLQTPVRDGFPTAILTASTGIAALDDGIRQLQQTGYIHNHMRLWLAGLVCNVAHCDWRLGAAWMHSYLIDGDYASNHLSWQWVAGSYTGKAYLPQQDNINTYTNSLQRGSYLDQPYEVIADMPVPTALQATTQVLPPLSAQLPSSTITMEALKAAPDILLYSPWTLDPNWRQNSGAVRVLLLDQAMFAPGCLSQNVLDSIIWFAAQIPNLEILYSKPVALQNLSTSIKRKNYPGIALWPGQVDSPELLYPNVETKFYPSFSAFWKQASKTPRQ